MNDEISFYKKSLVKRIFHLKQAQKRAKNPEWKAMWELKRKELMTKYMNNSK